MEEIVHPKGKVYYSMGEVCEMFGVNASLLRFWEKEFPMLKISKNSRGHRKYTTKDVDNIRLIYHLVKEQRMTLDGARRRLRNNPEGIEHDAEVVEHLRRIRNMLAALKAEMGDDTEVIDIDDAEDMAEEEATVAYEPAEVELAEETVAVEQVEEEPVEVEQVEEEPEAVEQVEEEPVVAEPVEEPAKAVPAEELADFRMEPQSSQQPAEEAPKKAHKGPKVGTLIGGNLFSPEDIRLAVAKKNSKEAKSQVIEQTLF